MKLCLLPCHKCPLDANMVPWIVALYSISSPAHESLHDPWQPSQEIQGVAFIEDVRRETIVGGCAYVEEML